MFDQVNNNINHLVVTRNLHFRFKLIRLNSDWLDVTCISRWTAKPTEEKGPYKTIIRLFGLWLQVHLVSSH